MLQYFRTHGARKGLADTALKTANSGVSHEKARRRGPGRCRRPIRRDPSTGSRLQFLIEGGEVIEHLGAEGSGKEFRLDLKDPDGEIIVAKNDEIREAHLKAIEDAGFEKVRIRSALTCRSKRGVCVLCSRTAFARGRLVSIGEAVGIVAAQSMASRERSSP